MTAPHWDKPETLSAQDLVALTSRYVSRLQRAEPAYRHALVRRVVQRMGVEGYPVFLKMLMTVGAIGDRQAQDLVNDTMLYAVERNELPTGVLSAWGGTAGLQDAARRGYGPIEYLVAWRLQPTQRQPLSQPVFSQSMAGLLNLFRKNSRLTGLYSQKLLADAQNPLEGGYTAEVREQLLALGQAWQAGEPTAAIVDGVSAKTVAKVSNVQVFNL